MDSTQPSSDDETLDFPGLHHPSEDFASDIFYPDNLLPTRSCLSGLSLAQLFDDVLCWSSDSEEMILDNTKPDSAYQLPLSEGVGLTDSLASRSIWDSVDEDEDSGSKSCDVSAPRANACTWMVGLTWFLVPFAAYEYPHLPQKPELTCRSAHEDFFALDDNVYVPPDLGIFDEDANGDAAVLFALN